MGPRSSVKDIAHDMKMIYYKPLDKVAQCNYKIRCPSYTYYRVYDLVIIGFLVLDGLQDPGNLGTILRTAAAAGYGGAVILKGTADVYAPKVTRAAAGALFRLPMYFAETAEEAAALLKEMGKTIVGTTPRNGVSYLEADLTTGIALVIGNEGNGMSEAALAVCDRNVYIPMHTGMESLNAAVAAGILMYKSVEGAQRDSFSDKNK